MHSALYIGRLRHRRFAPRAHRVQLPAVHDVRRPCGARSRYSAAAGCGPRGARRPPGCAAPTTSAIRRVPIDAAVRDRVAAQHAARARGPDPHAHAPALLRRRIQPGHVLLLFRRDGHAASSPSSPRSPTRRGTNVTRTCSPTMPAPAPRVLRYRFAKEFHVSPFMPMDVRYDWRFGTPGAAPGRAHGEPRGRRARVRRHARSVAAGDQRPRRSRQRCSRSLHDCKRLAAHLLQALKLWSKRVPFHAHPAKVPAHAERRPLAALTPPRGLPADPALTGCGLRSTPSPERAVSRQAAGVARRPARARARARERHRFGAASAALPEPIVIHVHDARFYGDVAFGGSIGAGEAYMRGRLDHDRSSSRWCACSCSTWTCSTGWRRRLARLTAPLRKVAARLAPQHPRGRAPQHRRALRSRQRFLPPVPRRDDDVFVARRSSTRHMSLHEAQLARLDLICRKLELKPTRPRARDRHRLGRLRAARRADATAAASRPPPSRASSGSLTRERVTRGRAFETASKCCARTTAISPALTTSSCRSR